MKTTLNYLSSSIPMNRLCWAFWPLLLCNACQWQLDEKVLFQQRPVISTGDGGNFTPYSITVPITLQTVNVALPVTEYGLCYYGLNRPRLTTDSLPTVSNQTVKGTILPPTTATPYSLTLTELQPGITYYIRAYAKTERTPPVYGEMKAMATLKLEWEKINDFGGSARFGTVSFVLGNRAYVAGGQKAIDVQKDDYANYDDLWEFDPAGKGSWTQRKSMILSLKGKGGVAFSVNDKAYAYGFLEGRINPIPDFLYKPIITYKAATDAWTNEVDTTNGPNSTQGAACVLNGRAYVGVAFTDNFKPKTEVSVLNGNNGRWETPIPVPNDLIGRFQLFAFAQNGKCYFGGGVDARTNAEQYSVWELDPLKPTGSQWKQQPDVPGKTYFDRAAAIGNRAFIVSLSGDLYEFVNNDWKPIVTGNVDGGVQKLETFRFIGAFFALNDRLYYGLGNNLNKSFWSIKP